MNEYAARIAKSLELISKELQDFNGKIRNQREESIKTDKDAIEKRLELKNLELTAMSTASFLKTETIKKKDAEIAALEARIKELETPVAPATT